MNPSVEGDPLRIIATAGPSRSFLPCTCRLVSSDKMEQGLGALERCAVCRYSFDKVDRLGALATAATTPATAATISDGSTALITAVRDFFTVTIGHFIAFGSLVSVININNR